MSFTFRFSTILAIREHQRDEAAAKVATIQAELAAIATKRREIVAVRGSLRDSMIQQRTQIISGQSIKSQQDYLAALQHEDTMLAQQQNQTTSLLNTAKADLIGKHREAAQLEKLHAREQIQHSSEMKRAEQRDHDEIALAQHRGLQR